MNNSKQKQVNDIKIGQKLWLYGKIPCIVTEIWPENECHSAGFRTDIIKKYTNITEEFRVDDIGISIFTEKINE